MKKVTDRESLKQFTLKAENIIHKYHWENKIVYPYANCPVSAMKIINECKDYDRCTTGSKEYLILLAEGFRKRLEAWIKYEEAPKVTVKIIASGKIKQILASDVEIFRDFIEVIE